MCGCEGYGSLPLGAQFTCGFSQLFDLMFVCLLVSLDFLMLFNCADNDYQLAVMELASITVSYFSLFFLEMAPRGQATKKAIQR